MARFLIMKNVECINLVWNIHFNFKNFKRKKNVENAKLEFFNCR